MTEANPARVTELLLRLRPPGGGGTDRNVEAELYTALYSELRRLANLLFVNERAAHTLQPTALVHEAFLRLVRSEHLDIQDRQHFLRVAARAMRQVLVDHARHRATRKRGGGQAHLPLDEDLESDPIELGQVLDLNRAIDKLGNLDQRMAQVVEMRVFAGLTREEIGALLGVSERTVAGDWSVARKWLARELSAAPERESE